MTMTNWCERDVVEIKDSYDATITVEIENIIDENAFEDIIDEIKNLGVAYIDSWEYNGFFFATFNHFVDCNDNADNMVDKINDILRKYAEQWGDENPNYPFELEYFASEEE